MPWENPCHFLLIRITIRSRSFLSRLALSVLFSFGLILEVKNMFDSLDEQMKHDDQMETTPRERILRWVAVAFVSVLVFSGLYYGVRMLE